MTNTNVTVKQLAPLGGTTSGGWKVGFIDSKAKAAQNDTWTVTNASEIVWALASLDSSGVADACTLSTNVVTLTGAGTGASSAFVIYR